MKNNVAMVIPAANESAAQQVVDKSGHLTMTEVSTLADAQDKMGGYLGMKKACREAITAVFRAADQSDRRSEVMRLGEASFFAIINAVRFAEQERGRDVAPLMAATEAYRSSLTGEHDRQASVRELQRAIAKAAGWRVRRHIGPASLAASNAVAAFITWDLAKEGDGYTTRHRQLLIGPWLRVAELPPL